MKARFWKWYRYIGSNILMSLIFIYVFACSVSDYGWVETLLWSLLAIPLFIIAYAAINWRIGRLKKGRS